MRRYNTNCLSCTSETQNITIHIQAQENEKQIAIYKAKYIINTRTKSSNKNYSN